MAKGKEKIIAGLDLGSTKVKAVVAKVFDDASEDDRIEIIGMADKSSHGIYRGIVTDMISSIDAIRSVIEQAQEMADWEAEEIIVGIGGSHLSYKICSSSCKIAHGDITEDEIHILLDASSSSIDLSTNQKIIHNIPQYYIIDNRESHPITNPYGLSGSRLDMSACLVTIAQNVHQDISKCLNHADIKYARIFSNSIAASKIVIDEDDKKLGTCVIDFGGNITSIAIYTRGVLRHLSAIEVAGSHVSRDLAVALHIPPKEAEDIKIKYCQFRKSDVSHDEDIELSHGHVVSALNVIDIIEQRYRDILELVALHLKRSGYSDDIGRNIVCIGGGAEYKLLPNMVHEIFEMPAKVNPPIVSDLFINASTCPPHIYTSALGLLLMRQDHLYPYGESYTFGRKNSFIKDLISWL